jgi:hypothetical protein
VTPKRIPRRAFMYIDYSRDAIVCSANGTRPAQACGKSQYFRKKYVEAGVQHPPGLAVGVRLLRIEKLASNDAV